MIKNSEITFNSPSSLSGKKPNGAPEKPDFKAIREKKKLDQLQQDRKKIEKKIQTLRKTPFASILRKMALNLKIAQDPNSDPQDLTTQVRPVLTSIDRFLSGSTTLTFVEELDKYKDDSTIFISFSHRGGQLGISPFSEHSEPRGVFAFPLKDVWSIISAGKIPSKDPGMIKPFVHVIKIISKNILNLQENISSQEYQQRLNLIKSKNHKDIVNEYLNKNGLSNKNLYKSIFLNFEPETQSAILIEMGYDVIIDKDNIISKEEKMQAIFLTMDSFKEVNKFKINPEEMNVL